MRIFVALGSRANIEVVRRLTRVYLKSSSL
jgi:hypothetical protein